MPKTIKNKGSKSHVLKIAWPIGISMISYTLKGFVDTLMVAQLGLDALAAVGFAGIIAWTLVSFPFGALRGQRPLVSQYLGVGDLKLSLSFGVHAFYFACCIALIFLVSAQGLGSITTELGSSSNMSEQSSQWAGEYLKFRMWWAAPMLLGLAIAEYLRSIEKTRLPMLADLLSHPLNILFNYVLIFGHWGFPKLGIQGAAIGTGLADLVSLLFLLWVSQAQSKMNWSEKKTTLIFHWNRMIRILSVGYTGGIQFALESVSFLIITYFIGFLGTTSLAIQQAAIQLVHLSILPVVAIADGGSVLVGKFVGEQQWQLVHQVTRSVLELAIIFMGCMGVLYVFWGENLMSLFLTDQNTESQQNAIFLGGKVALAIAFWQIGDAFQVTYRHCLRATGDHKWVMWVGILISWILNVPLVAFVIFYLQGDIFHAWLAVGMEIYIGAWLFHRRWKSEIWKEKRLVD